MSVGSRLNGVPCWTDCGEADQLVEGGLMPPMSHTVTVHFRNHHAEVRLRTTCVWSPSLRYGRFLAASAVHAARNSLDYGL